MTAAPDLETLYERALAATQSNDATELERMQRCADLCRGQLAAIAERRARGAHFDLSARDLDQVELVLRKAIDEMTAWIRRWN